MPTQIRIANKSQLNTHRIQAGDGTLLVPVAQLASNLTPHRQLREGVTLRLAVYCHDFYVNEARRYWTTAVYARDPT